MEKNSEETVLSGLLGPGLEAYRQHVQELEDGLFYSTGIPADRLGPAEKEPPFSGEGIFRTLQRSGQRFPEFVVGPKGWAEFERAIAEAAAQGGYRIQPEAPKGFVPNLHQAGWPAAAVFPAAPGVLEAARAFCLSGPPPKCRLSGIGRKLPGNSSYAWQRPIPARFDNLGHLVSFLSRLFGDASRDFETSGLHQKSPERLDYTCSVNPASPGTGHSVFKITLNDLPDAAVSARGGRVPWIFADPDFGF